MHKRSKSINGYYTIQYALLIQSKIESKQSVAMIHYGSSSFCFKVDTGVCQKNALPCINFYLIFAVLIKFLVTIVQETLKFTMPDDDILIFLSF